MVGDGIRLLVRIEPWSEGDIRLLEKLLSDPAMTKYVGGPESLDKIAERQTRYQRPGSRQFKIVDEATGEGAGWVGYWERTWNDELVYEIGWSVLPGFQGRGIASAATTQAIAQARAEKHLRFVHAYPMVDNGPSNTICRKVGFTLMGEIDFPGAQGGFVKRNDWRLDLFERS